MEVKDTGLQVGEPLHPRGHRPHLPSTLSSLTARPPSPPSEPAPDTSSPAWRSLPEQPPVSCSGSSYKHRSREIHPEEAAAAHLAPPREQL